MTGAIDPRMAQAMIDMYYAGQRPMDRVELKYDPAVGFVATEHYDNGSEYRPAYGTGATPDAAVKEAIAEALAAKSLARVRGGRVSPFQPNL